MNIFLAADMSTFHVHENGPGHGPCMGLDIGQWAWTLDLKMDQKYGGGVTFTEVDFGHTAEVGIFSEVAFLSCEFSLQNSAVFARFRKKYDPEFKRKC
jgi:hypothetical protein